MLLLVLTTGCITPSRILERFDKTEALAKHKAGDPGSKRFDKFDTLKTHWCRINAPVVIGKGKTVYLPGKPKHDTVKGETIYVNCDSLKKAGAETAKVKVPCPPTTIIITRVDTSQRTDTAVDAREIRLLKAHLSGCQQDVIKAWDAASKANIRANNAEGKIRARTWAAVASWLLLLVVFAITLLNRFRK